MNPSNLNPKSHQPKEHQGDYGNEIAVINRQTTEEDFSDNYNDYHSNPNVTKGETKEQE